MKGQKLALTTALIGCLSASYSFAEKPIVHDAEHYVLLDQHEEQWQQEDKTIDSRLAELKKQNGGKPPNIIYILIDDVGFGEFGNPLLNDVRGYKTPSINEFAEQSMSFSRMYSEPSCTPTRAAFLTGRLPIRSHMLEPKIVPPEGTGLHKDEVTIAEVLSQAGYNTAHVGKWHQGDIEQSYPHNQGFDETSFTMHNQATFSFMTNESETDRWPYNVSHTIEDHPYVLDSNFRPKDWVLALDAKKGEQAKEWGIEPGEALTYDYYYKMNEHQQKVAVGHLQRLAKEDEPFFLNYWPQYPVDFSRPENMEKTDNGGSWVGRMQQLDGWIGDILDEVDNLGIADNTVIVIMGDNGPMVQALGSSGYTDMIYRGYKGETTEGGIRVSAFIRWPKVIEAGSMAGDMIHVTDLYTSFARIAGATEFIPRDRIVDGIDQTALFINGDGRSRRDYIHMYNGPTYAATIKQQFKVHWPAPGTAAFKLPIYNLYRDPREEKPLNVEGMWTVGYFEEMRGRHAAFLKKFPSREETEGRPYAGISNLRPETVQFLDKYLKRRELLEN
ncbi:MAG: sulfatase-like hydrolase/transferase [Halopseudomonas aestusnigri]